LCGPPIKVVTPFDGRRFKRLRTPANVLVMNLTACDLISCLIHPMAIYSAYRGRWSFGKTGESFCLNADEFIRQIMSSYFRIRCSGYF
jgi:7 transmembrane receptor (rhodopsin family)